jgi:chromosome segregation ATPase
MPTFTHENEDGGVAERSHSAAASTTTAMTLWHKFANWQNEMEECRSKVRNVRQQQEQCMAQIANLQAIRKMETMQMEQLQQMHEASDSLGQEPSLGLLQDLQRQLDEADKEYRIAAASLKNLQQQSVAQTEQRHETMQQVLNQSRQFRWDCQQLQQQLQATVPEEEFLCSVNGFRDNFDVSKDISSTANSLRAALYAILTSKSGLSDVGSEDPWITKTLQNLRSFTAEYVEPEDVDENDPSTWTFIRENDVDFHSVIAEYKRERKALDMTTQELQTLQKKQEVIQSKAHDRNQRVVQLQEQLDRLQGDCSRMEAEINRYQQLILDDEKLAHTYRESKSSPELVLISLGTILTVLFPSF